MADLIVGYSHSHPLVPYWNMLMRSGFFLFVVVILSKLKTALEHEKNLSRTDSLTGTANKRAFYELASIEIDRARRYKRPFTAAYIDIDNFKTINDRFGHTIGDCLLQLVATTIRSKTRSTDAVARLGGDEFILLLPETEGESAQKVLHRIQNQLLDAVQKNEWPVTFSIGVATFINPPESVEEMIKKADALMYSAKNSGKNMIKQAVFR
jgi:diguanylate cyclase (GGDEF)-like protein